MLESTKQHINEVLEESEEYKKLMNEIGLNDENINLIIKLENLIKEIAYLKGYADGLEESTIKKVKEDPGKYLNIGEIHKLTDEMGITEHIEKPAAVDNS